MPPKRKNTSEEASPSSSKIAKIASSKQLKPSENGDKSHENMLRISSWNVNGIRAWLKKTGMSYVTETQPDMICLQETKCGLKDLPTELKSLKHYHAKPAIEKATPASVLLTKIEPTAVTFGMGIKEHDDEGRLITAEFEKFYLIGAYVPNSGRGLVRLDYRQKWDVDLRNYLLSLDKKKPIIFCGDLNVAHTEIDLANPKSNDNKTAGYTAQERNGFTTLLSYNLVDSFRHFYPTAKEKYTFWSQMHNARAKNTGWRLDYFVVSRRLMANVVSSEIEAHVMGSDHCPIVLEIDVS